MSSARCRRANFWPGSRGRRGAGERTGPRGKGLLAPLDAIAPVAVRIGDVPGRLFNPTAVILLRRDVERSIELVLRRGYIDVLQRLLKRVARRRKDDRVLGVLGVVENAEPT